MISFWELGQKGRLGNQLFQLASTIGIARSIGQEPIFPHDWMYRPYFNVPDEMFGDPGECSWTTAQSYVKYMDPRCVDYLQDVGLFLRYLDEIREYLTPSDRAWQEVMPNICSHPHICVHVRRGDNIYDPNVPNKADYHPTPPLEYHLKGIAQFDSSIPLWIFSDDIDWCVKHLPLAEYYGHGKAYPKEHEPEYGKEVPTDWIDLFKMSQCDAFVVSVSTFGIWGALMSGCSPEEVFRPNKVYGPELSYIDDDALFHPQWEVLPCF